jgi:hypothetical protein
MLKSLIVMLFILLAARGLTIQFLGSVNYGRALGFAQGYGNTLINLVKLSFKTPVLTSICNLIDQNKLWASITAILSIAGSAITAFCVAFTKEQKLRAIEELGHQMLEHAERKMMIQDIQGGIQERIELQTQEYMKGLRGGQCSYLQYGSTIAIVVVIGSTLGYLAYERAQSEFEKKHGRDFLDVNNTSLLDYVVLPKGLYSLALRYTVGETWKELKTLFTFFLDYLIVTVDIAIKIGKAGINVDKARLAYELDNSPFKDITLQYTLPGTRTTLHNYETEYGRLQTLPLGSVFASQSVNWGLISFILMTIFASVQYAAPFINSLINAACKVIFKGSKAQDALNDLKKVAEDIVLNPKVKQEIQLASQTKRASPVRNSPSMASPVRNSPSKASPVKLSPSMASPVRNSKASPLRASPVRTSPVRTSPYYKRSPSRSKSKSRSVSRMSIDDGFTQMERDALMSSGLYESAAYLSRDQLEPIFDAYRKTNGL